VVRESLDTIREVVLACTMWSVCIVMALALCHVTQCVSFKIEN
jgi:hypothetical protein